MLNPLHVPYFKGGSHTNNGAFDFCVECKERIALGGLNLRIIRFNSKEQENLVVDKFHKEISDENTVLGLIWNENSDEIIFDTLKIWKTVPTIITIFSIIQFLAAIYDPLGLINTLIVKLEVLFSDICVEKYD